MDVGWERQPTAELRSPGVYVFWLYNSRRPNPMGSVTIGYYSIDKCTGIIKEDESGTVVTSPTLEGVQRIMARRESSECNLQ